MADDPRPKFARQYIGAAIVSLGGLSIGTAFGWSSPVTALLEKQMPKEKKNIFWIVSIMPLGAAMSIIIIGFLINILGRKYSLFVMGIVTCFGYVILMFAKNVPVYCIGRFITGFGAGTFCVTCPTYVSEFAHRDVRGLLGTFFPFQMVTGILLAYSLGELGSFWALNVPCAIIPIVMDVCLLFLPESPVFLYDQGKEEAAKNSLRFFRGNDYPIEEELALIAEYSRRQDVNFWQIATQKSIIKRFLILIMLHILQQFSGINTVNFYAKSLFESVTPEIPGGVAAIIMRVVNIIFTGIAAFIVDKVGRRLLWLVSLATMGVMLFFVGFHFEMVDSKNSIQKTTGYLAVVCIFIYIIGFAIGAGPLPWVAAGELLPNSMKLLVSIAISINLLAAFLVTHTFPILVAEIGPAAVFWIYGSFCVLGFIFILVCLTETARQSLTDIQKQVEIIGH